MSTPVVTIFKKGYQDRNETSLGSNISWDDLLMYGSYHAFQSFQVKCVGAPLVDKALEPVLVVVVEWGRVWVVTAVTIPPCETSAVVSRRRLCGRS